MNLLTRKPKQFRNGALALLAVATLSLTACGGNPESGSGEKLEVKPDGNYNQVAREELQEGGTLTLPLNELSAQQNPFHADGNLYTNNVWRWYNPQVALFDGAGEYSPNPDYITDVKDETVDGKTRITYTIHDEAQFNDGTPIDWKTFEHTWQFNNGTNEELNVSSTDGYRLIESVTAGENDKQAVVTYSQAYPWWQGLFNFLLPTQVADATTFNEAYINQLHPEWGAGPYKVDSVDFNTGTVSFVPNENWWGDKGLLDKVTYRYMESQASINAFKAGEIDATGVADRDRYATAKGMGDKADLRAALLPSNYLLTLNSQAPGLEDEKVREAIMTGIDRAQLAAIRFNGLDYEEDLPGSFVLYQTQEGYRDNFSEVVTYDVEKAKQLLEEAGYTPGADGIVEKDGEKLSLRYVSTGDSSMVKSTASALQEMFRQMGIELRVEERPSSDFSEIMTQRDFDIIAMGFSSGDPFGVAYFDQIYNSNSELNKSGTGSPEFDQKIEEVAKMSDPNEQTERANELEVEAFQHYGIMPYANGPDMVATKPGLANYGAYSFAVVPVEDIGWEK